MSEQVPVFETVLSPHRSLSGPGFLIVMGVFGAASFAAGVAFLSMGAWPVIGFFGLDVLLLYIAFRLNYRAGQLQEHIRLTAAALDVSRRAPSGSESRWRFQPYWVRLTHDRPEDHDGELSLSSHGQRLVIGSFLAPEQRTALAGGLGAALARVKSGSH